jgi:hypothetical protein
MNTNYLMDSITGNPIISSVTNGDNVIAVTHTYVNCPPIEARRDGRENWKANRLAYK